MDPQGSEWHELGWSQWTTLDPTNEALSTVPTGPGLYRVRHRDRNGLEYIGETGRTRGRIRALARGVHAEEMPFRDPHTAAPCLWAIRDVNGVGFEVSYVTPEEATDTQYRKGLEAALIAQYRKAAGESPTANFGRIIPGYRQSSYSRDDRRGGPLGPDESEPNATLGVGPLPWTNVSEITSPDWMGLSWSKPYPLSQRLDADPPKTGLYRIWYTDHDVLAYIGESGDIPSRLYSHESTFGAAALFAYTDRPNLDASHKRQEIETELIGAHYLICDQPPLAQFGYTDNLPK